MAITAIARAEEVEEKCVPGGNTDIGKAWELTLNGDTFYLVGNICGAGNGEWEGKDVDGNTVYYKGTYHLKSINVSEAKSKLW